MTITPRRYTDRQILATARLVENLATIAPDALAHLRQQLGHIDGYRTQTAGANPDPGPLAPSRPLTGTCNAYTLTDDGDPANCANPRPCPDHDHPVTLTGVEATLDWRLDIERRYRDIEAQIKLITVATSDVLRNCHNALGTRAPAPPEPCKAGLKGKDGALEWGDPLCDDAAHKAGLCPRHYTAWYRWRKRQGLDITAMHEPAATGRNPRPA